MEQEKPRPKSREEMKKDIARSFDKAIEDVAKEKGVPIILVKISVFDFLFGPRKRS